MGQGVHTVALQVAAQELGVDPARIEVVVDTTRELGARPDHRVAGHADGRGRGAGGLRAAMAGGCQPGVDYEGEYRVDWTNKLGDPASSTRSSTPRSATPRSWSVIDRETGRDRAGRRRPRRRPGRQPAAVRGPDRGLGAHGPRLRAHRGLPGRRHAAPDQHDAALLGILRRQGRAADRRDPRRGRRSRTRRTASRASARSASCRPPARSPPRCTTSTASGAATLPMRRAGGLVDADAT